MTINYYPNDFRATRHCPMRIKRAIASRKANQTGFYFPSLGKQQPYKTNNLGFVRWQIREAALTTLKVFEQIDGPLTQWARSVRRKVLNVEYNKVNDINAYYSGDEIAFYQVIHRNVVHFTGASTDIVSHEVGHAILDAIRPDLWDIEYLEVAAFHEAFGDCMALITALSDKKIRSDLVINKRLGRQNYVETIGEHLAWLCANNPPARQALNKLKWSLPTAGDEPHDFSRSFTGCFYDVIRARFDAGKNKTELGLWQATKVAAKLLFAASHAAPPVPRFFQAIGRAMALEAGKGTPLAALITKAFEDHGIKLGSAVMTSEKARLAGIAGRRTARRWSLSDDALEDLRSRMGVDSIGKFQVRPVRLGKQVVAEAIYPRSINIGSLPKIPKGARTYVPEAVLVGYSSDTVKARRSLALMSALPDSKSIEIEVLDFVDGLAQRGQIQDATGLNALRRSPHARRTALGASTTGVGSAEVIAHPGPAPGVTHELRLAQEGSGVTLQRIRFSCRCTAHYDRRTL